MKLKYTLLALGCMTAATAMAVPAKHGVVRTFTQPDGTTVQLELIGDEYHHHYLTTDGQVVLNQGNGFYYAVLDQDGMPQVSEMLARDFQNRTSAENAFLSTLQPANVSRAIMTRQNVESRNSHDGNGLFYNSTFPTTGDVPAVVLLVQYTDVQFSMENPNDYYSRFLMEEGFSDNGATGSCFDYFNENSEGQFTPQFDVFGPVTLPHNMAYYGGNNSYGSDMRPQQMMLHAAQQLDAEVDFSIYDTDGNGFVDNVYIIYAGYGEADYGSADSVWPHSSTVGYNPSYRFDGVQLNRYACGNEIGEDDLPDGIGTFTHEFSHVMGLPDLYNTEDAYANYTPGSWSLMDQGTYNNKGRTPPAYSSFERNALGWMGENLVEISEPCDITLEDLRTSNSACVISTSKPDEYFLFENRQQQGWDKYLKYHGMLVWHIDYKASVWAMNAVNNDKNHQYVDLVEASGAVSSQTIGIRKYPFPGSAKVTKFVYGGKPSFQTWNGDNLHLDITDIAETDGVITFKVGGGGTTGIGSVTVGNDENAGIYNLQGVLVSESGDTTKLPAGIYVRAGRKFVVK